MKKYKNLLINPIFLKPVCILFIVNSIFIYMALIDFLSATQSAEIQPNFFLFGIFVLQSLGTSIYALPITFVIWISTIVLTLFKNSLIFLKFDTRKFFLHYLFTIVLCSSIIQFLLLLFIISMFSLLNGLSFYTNINYVKEIGNNLNVFLSGYPNYLIASLKIIILSFLYYLFLGNLILCFTLFFKNKKTPVSLLILLIVGQSILYLYSLNSDFWSFFPINQYIMISSNTSVSLSVMYFIVFIIIMYFLCGAVLNRKEIDF